MEEKKGNEIELRSEEVQEIMGQIPIWIVRWGITLLFGIVLILLIGSYFFRYPDVVTTEMTLTGRHPAVQLVARSAGRLSCLYVTDGKLIESGKTLAIIENTASTEDIYYVENGVKQFSTQLDSTLSYFIASHELKLGDIQVDYLSFLQQLHEYQNYKTLDYYPQKKASIIEQIHKYKTYANNLGQQKFVMQEQYQIAGSQYQRDSLLYKQQVLSAAEHETARREWLQSRYSLEGASASLENLKIQIGQLEVSLLDLNLEQAEKEQVLLQNCHTAIEQLRNAIQNWKLNYCLITPVSGTVTFTRYWNANQYVSAGDPVFTVVPNEKEKLMGVAFLPIQRSGKVHFGQRVIIRFSNYPDQEFGIVEGIVRSVSLVPDENQYRAEIDLPNGLVTNYNRTLPALKEMQATAEIVTDDLRLIERVFMPLKRIWKEGFSN